MGLNFTGRNDTTIELVEKGDYEVTLSAEWNKKQSNDEPYINCKFRIRDDVEQSFGGRYVYDSIYKQKGTEDYNKSKINGILGAIPNAQLDFEDYDELVQYFNGKNMIVSIDIEPANAYHSKDRNIVKYLSYRASEVGDSATEIDDFNMTEVDDGDLPF